MGIAMGDASYRHNGVHQNRGAGAIGIHIVPSALRVIIVAAMNVHHSVFVKMELI